MDVLNCLLAACSLACSLPVVLHPTFCSAPSFRVPSPHTPPAPPCTHPPQHVPARGPAISCPICNPNLYYTSTTPHPNLYFASPQPVLRLTPTCTTPHPNPYYTCPASHLHLPPPSAPPAPHPHLYRTRAAPQACPPPRSARPSRASSRTSVSVRTGAWSTRTS